MNEKETAEKLKDAQSRTLGAAEELLYYILKDMNARIEELERDRDSNSHS